MVAIKPFLLYYVILNDFVLSLWFTGFPRTVEQAKELLHVQEIDFIVNLRVPFEVIIDRIKGRWTHLPSGRIYHNEFNPPKVKVSTGIYALLPYLSSR